MAVFTAIAAAIGLGKIATAIFVSVATFATSMVVSRLIAKRAMRKGMAGGDGGGRVQLPPATDNKIPVIYGTAFVGGPVTDAHLTTDNKTMYYVITLAEHTDTTVSSGYTFDTGNIFYDGKQVTFGSDGVGGTTKVVSLTTNTTPAQLDTKINGFLNIYLYKNGSTGATSGENTTQNAYDVMPNWDNTYAMTNACFAVVKVQYNVDAGTTNLGSLTFKITNSIDKPGSAIKDYMLNTRYGAAIPLARIDTDSLDDLDTYSDQLIDYTDVDSNPDQQARYRINGPLDTSNNCLDNLQVLVDSCDSWLQYSELSGKWKVVINKKYDEAPNSVNTNDLFLVNSDNLLGGIAINPIDLNDTYNELEVAYPNQFIKDQTDYQVIELSDYQVGVMSPNEALNRINVTLPLVNNAVQAKYLGIRRLLQSREDLVISFVTDFSGIQVEAGDVIRVTHETYGWTEKLFRVSSVAEEKMQDGSLQASFVAFEYNGTILEDQALQDYIPAYNTGLLDPNVFDTPDAPTVSNGNITTASTTSLDVAAIVPQNGVITYMDFNYGYDSNTSNHVLYRTLQAGIGQPFSANSNLVINVNDVSAGNLFWSISARNDFAGRTSNASNVFVWAGPAVSTYDPISNTGGITGNNIVPGSIDPNIFPANVTFIDIVNALPTCNSNTIGKTVFLDTDGKLYTCDGNIFTPVAANTNITGNIISSQISNVFANSVFGNLSNANIPNTRIDGNIIANQISNVFGNIVFGNLSNANIPNANIIGQLVASQIANVSNTAIIGQLVASQIANVSNTAIIGEIVAGQIANAAITSDKLAANSVIAGKIFTDAVTATTIAAGAVVAGKIAADAVTANTIAANAVIAGKIAADAVTANTIATNAVTSDKILANAVIAGKIAADAVTANTIAANAVIAGKIAADAVGANQIIANSITAAQIAAGTITSSEIAANTILANNIAASTITGNQIAAGSVFGNRIVGLSITAAEIAAGAITTDKMTANTINGDRITAGTIAAAKISVTELSALSANMGTLTAGTLKTTNTTGNRVEISSVGNLPLWFGSGTKDTANAKFYLDDGGNAFFAGELAANTVTTNSIAVGNVTTDRIATQAVTISESDTPANTTLTSANSNVDNTLSSVVISTIASTNVLVRSDLTFSFSNATGGLTNTYKIKRDGNTIATIPLASLTSGGTYRVPLQFLDTPGSGNITYDITVNPVIGGITTFTYSTIITTVTEFKR